MPSYSYEVRDSGGAATSGVVEANNIEDAGQRLRRQGATVVDLKQQSGRASAPAPLKKIKPDDVLFFANQLAVMIDTGVTITEALDCIAENTTHTGLAAMVEDLADQVKSGVEFSVALARHPKQFDPLFINMVRASEASGTMGSMLLRVCDYMRGEREIRKQVAGAMVYPIGLLGFSVTIVLAMMVFVLPRFEKIYAGKGAVLPLPTRILLGVSNVLVGNWILLTLALIGGIVGFILWKKSESGQMTLDRWKVSAPLFGPLYTKLFVSRSLRTLGTMLTAGVDMLEAIEITAGVVGNSVYRRMWLDVAEQLRQGETLSEQLFRSDTMPRSISQMIASGEKSGRLPDVMARVSDFCEADLKIGVKSMTTMIEPLMIIIMGLLVGGIAISLLLPIFSISNVVAH